jgi:predicted lipoprotein with Yx(FWY)xxD motif
VALGPSQYGKVLFDGKKRALYTFATDGRGKSRCAGACLKAWPPFLVRAKPAPLRGVDASLVGTRRTPDGKLQVTYDGRPLYYWYGDPPSKVLCAGVNEFGGGWYAVSARGARRG